MKAHHRKAKLKRARQHQKYHDSPTYQERQRIKWQIDLKRYNEECEQFERETYAEWNAENRLALKRVSIIVLSWVVAVLGIAWVAERLV